MARPPKVSEIEVERFPVIARAFYLGEYATLVTENAQSLRLTKPTNPRLTGTIPQDYLDFIRHKALGVTREKLMEKYGLKSHRDFDTRAAWIKERLGATREGTQYVRRLWEHDLSGQKQRARLGIPSDIVALRGLVILGLISQGFDRARTERVTKLERYQIATALNHLTRYLGIEGCSYGFKTAARTNIAFLRGLLAPDKAMSVDGFVEPGVNRLLDPDHTLIIPAKLRR